MELRGLPCGSGFCQTQPCPPRLWATADPTIMTTITAETQRRRGILLYVDRSIGSIIKRLVFFSLRLCVSASLRLKFLNADRRHQLIQHLDIDLALCGDLPCGLVGDLLDLVAGMALDPLPFNLVL